MKLSGSSMATGVVSGLVALMIEAHNYGAYERYTSSVTGRQKKLNPYVAPPTLTPNVIKDEWRAGRATDAAIVH